MPGILALVADKEKESEEENPGWSTPKFQADGISALVGGASPHSLPSLWHVVVTCTRGFL
ncbi:hypothetical protein I79_019027 [Cricetulus griseus]|uniref:Uncharacterized protein n=1 Tax=Cricetulus griseus TaxID=10029 RepID=G3I6B4_CRIGR|nr:hypothetical protein I79_019027 [Cricetulus griseus]